MLVWSCIDKGIYRNNKRIAQFPTLGNKAYASGTDTITQEEISMKIMFFW